VSKSETNLTTKNTNRYVISKSSIQFKDFLKPKVQTRSTRTCTTHTHQPVAYTCEWSVSEPRSSSSVTEARKRIPCEW
jgi:hypothetical protein